MQAHTQGGQRYQLSQLPHIPGQNKILSCEKHRRQRNKAYLQSAELTFSELEMQVGERHFFVLLLNLNITMCRRILPSCPVHRANGGGRKAGMRAGVKLNLLLNRASADQGSQETKQSLSRISFLTPGCLLLYAQSSYSSLT